MKTLITILLSSLLLCSCMTDKKLAKICATCPVKTETITMVKDSAWFFTDTVTIEKIVSIPGPTIVVPGPCDKLCDGKGKLKSFYTESTHNGIKSKLYTDTAKNVIKSDCNADSLKTEIEKITNRYNRLLSESKSTTDTKVVKVNELTWLQRFFIYTSYIFWLIIIIFTGIKIAKIYLKTKL